MCAAQRTLPRSLMRRGQHDGGLARLETRAMSVMAMHSLADKIRKDGGSVFFAAIDE